MEDLKLYTKNDDDLESLQSTVKRFSDDIGIQFGQNKCAKVTFRKGLLVKSKNFILGINTEIADLDYTFG